MPVPMTTADELYAECLLPALRLSETVAAFPVAEPGDPAWRLAAFDALESMADEASRAAAGAMRHMGIAVAGEGREAVYTAFALSSAEWEGWHPHPMAALLVSTARELERAAASALEGGAVSVGHVADDLFAGAVATLEACGRKAVRTERGFEVT